MQEGCLDGCVVVVNSDGFFCVQVPAAEMLVYQDIAVLAASFSLSHSKWNNKFPADVAVLRVKETLDYEVKASDVHEVSELSSGCEEGVEGAELLSFVIVADGLANREIHPRP